MKHIYNKGVHIFVHKRLFTFFIENKASNLMQYMFGNNKLSLVNRMNYDNNKKALNYYYILTVTEGLVQRFTSSMFLFFQHMYTSIDDNDLEKEQI